MNSMSNTDKTQVHTRSSDRWIVVLWILAALANIKSIFADYDVDLSYAVAMSYRHLIGDRMFAEMLEPHQTSSFIIDGLMYIFKVVTGGYEGVVIYLNICGVMLYAGLCLFLVKTLEKYTGKFSANMAGILVFTFRVRQVVMPEFTNMMMGFSILLIIFLIKYLGEGGKMRYLIIAATALCLTVLSYPSSLVIFPVVIIILVMYSDRKIRDIVVFSAVCVVLGLIYAGRIVLAVGGDTLIDNLNLMIEGDSWHSSDRTPGMYTYFRDTLRGVVWMAGSVTIAFVVSLPARLGKKKTFRVLFGTVFAFVLMISDILCTAFLKNLTLRYVYGTVLILFTVWGVFYLKGCSDIGKKIWVVSLFISVGDCLAVALLTNMELITVIQYLIPVATISFVALCERFMKCGGRAYFVTVMLVLVVIVHRGLIIRPYSGPGTSIMDIENIVRIGPAKGIACDYMSAYMTACNDEDLELYVDTIDSLLVVNSELCDPLVYMLRSSKVGHYSVIDTPTYNEFLDIYWEKNPDKVPDVIAVECWYGEMHIDEDSWIMGRIAGGYECVGEGRYYRLYRRI